VQTPQRVAQRLARHIQTRLFRHIHDRRVHACLRCQRVTRGRRNAPARGPAFS
jgi:hypothetical protein